MTTDTNAFVDVGEKLGGARKDTWSDLIKQGKDATTVAALWPTPDWKALIEELAAREGYADRTAQWGAVTCYVVREMMIATQRRTTAFSGGRGGSQMPGDVGHLRVPYICGLHDAILDLGVPGAGLESFAGAVLEFADILVADSEAPSLELAANKLAWTAGVQPRWVRYAEKRSLLVTGIADAARQVLAAGWPDVEPKKKRGGSLLIPRRPVLKQEELTRSGPERENEIRTGEDLDKIFCSTFGVRGLEFGNYVPDNGERQLNANLAYHALLDLADVLGVEPHVVGRGRSGSGLGIGIGSRGKGAITGAAHYEPWSVVINLTRLMGDGSLAHEMGHKFDHGLSGYVFDREAILEAKRAGADKSDLQKADLPIRALDCPS
jgi:hypothetical protein